MTGDVNLTHIRPKYAPYAGKRASQITREERIAFFMTRVEKRADGCWVWTGWTNEGYGWLRIDGKLRAAHRLFYELRHGDPGDLVVHHECRNRLCVNPDHLRALTRGDHSLVHGDVLSMAQNRAREKNLSRTHCKRGHELTPENTTVRKDGYRACLACRRIHNSNRPSRQRAALGDGQ